MPSFLWSALVPPAAKHLKQHDAANPAHYNWNGVLRLASFPLCPPNVTMVIVAKQFNFSFIRPQDMSLKIKIFVPVYIFNLWSGFYMLILE